MQFRTAAVVVTIAAAIFVASLSVPAFGGPSVLGSGSPSKIAKRALKLAKKADARSKEALSESQKVGAKGQPGVAGPRGATGPAGAPGAAGAPGDDAFGSLTYVRGPGDSTPDPDTYAIDGAVCPSGQYPTGGSFSPAGSELGGTLALGDYGDRALDLDDPPDGIVDAWIAWVYNATGSADIIAYAVCAPAGTVSVAARSVVRNDPQEEALRKLWLQRKG